MSVPDAAPDDGGPVVDFPRLGALERPFAAKDSEALRDVLVDFAIDVQFNVRTRRIEWFGFADFEREEIWRPMTDRKLADLRERIARQYFVQTPGGVRPLKWGRDAFHDTLNALVYYRERDPFMDWLDQLPPWDGHQRLEGMLCNMFNVAWSGLAEWASQYIFLGAVQRTYEPGSKLDECVVLIGDQGRGKSALLREAVPSGIPGLYGDGLRWDARDKEQVEAVLGRAIVEVPEMGGRRKAEIEHMKAFISRQDDGAVRLPYARTPEPLERRFIIVATTNDANDLPNDATGLRRFVPIVLNTGCDVESWMAAERENLWAEALAMYRAGRRANLPRDMHDRQREAAEEHRDKDELLEDAVAGLHGDGPFTLSAIANLLDMKGKRYADPIPESGLTRTG
ncbi:MAG: hypothetical protein OXP75_20090, partial [Rhodospirillales bacterium]|nr:hypothetical protein [Rhodospirillales bacterium]